MPRARVPRRSLTALLCAAALCGPATTLAQGPTPSPAPGPAPVHGPRVLYRPIGCVQRGPLLNHHGPSRREVALTLDDGPWTDTRGFLDVLEKHRARATFFMIGGQIAGHEALLRRELRDGDVLGNHTFTHPHLTRSGDVSSQLSRTSQAIERAVGYRPCVFRPPYGDVNGSVVQAAASLGMATIVWDVDPTDYARPGSGVIERRILDQVRPGSIILDHDGGGPRQQTLQALPHVIGALRSRGYRLVTVPELLGYHTVYRRCVRDCRRAGAPGPLPRGSIVQRG